MSFHPFSLRSKGQMSRSAWVCTLLSAIVLWLWFRHLLRYSDRPPDPNQSFLINLVMPAFNFHPHHSYHPPIAKREIFFRHPIYEKDPNDFSLTIVSSTLLVSKNYLLTSLELLMEWCTVYYNILLTCLSSRWLCSVASQLYSHFPGYYVSGRTWNLVSCRS